MLHKPGVPIGIIEAKDNHYSGGSGMQQGLGYAAILDVPFVFSTNGDGFLMHDRLAIDGPVEREFGLDAFPSPQELIWRLWKSGAAKRILFLAACNILVDQTKTNDFQPFGNAMTKITDRNVDPARRSCSF